jgi:hypothetical protein
MLDRKTNIACPILTQTNQSGGARPAKKPDPFMKAANNTQKNKHLIIALFMISGLVNGHL